MLLHPHQRYRQKSELDPQNRIFVNPRRIALRAWSAVRFGAQSSAYSVLKGIAALLMNNIRPKRES